MSETIAVTSTVAFTRTFTEETILTCASAVPEDGPQTGIADFSVTEVGVDPPLTRKGTGAVVETMVPAGTYEIAVTPKTPGYAGTVEIV